MAEGDRLRTLGTLNLSGGGCGQQEPGRVQASTSVPWQGGGCCFLGTPLSGSPLPMPTPPGHWPSPGPNAAPGERWPWAGGLQSPDDPCLEHHDPWAAPRPQPPGEPVHWAPLPTCLCRPWTVCRSCPLPPAPQGLVPPISSSPGQAAPAAPPPSCWGGQSPGHGQPPPDLHIPSVGNLPLPLRAGAGVDGVLTSTGLTRVGVHHLGIPGLARSPSPSVL